MKNLLFILTLTFLCPLVYAKNSSTNTKLDSIIKDFKMKHIGEGGNLSQFYQSSTTIRNTLGCHGKTRHLVNTAYYELSSSHSNRFHKILVDEIWTYIDGSKFDLIILSPKIQKSIVLGRSFKPYAPPLGNINSVFIPAGSWMGGYAIKPLSGFTLFYLTDTPGFLNGDYNCEVTYAKKNDLLEKYPGYAYEIKKVFASPHLLLT